MSIFTYSKKTVTMPNSLKLIYRISKSYMLQPIQIAEHLPREALEKNMRVCLSLISQKSIGINTHFPERQQKK